MFYRSWALVLIFIFSFEASALTISELINLYDVPTYGESSELEQNLLASISQQFISDPKNKKILRSPIGTRLLQKQSKLLNLMEIQRVFKECEKDKDSRRQLYLRILSTAKIVEPVEINCRKNLTKFKTLKSFSKEIQKLAKVVELDNLQKDLHQHSFSNIIRSYVFMKKKFSKNVDDEELIKELCFNKYQVDRCSEKNKKHYLAVAKKELKSLKAVKSISFNSAAVALNAKISNINDKIKLIKPKTDQGWFNNFAFDSSDPVYDEKSDKAYENYQQTYIEEATSGIGTLLMSKSLKSKVTGLKAKEQDEFESSDTSKNTTRYWFEEHREIDKEDVESGVEDALGQMRKQAGKLNFLENLRKQEKEQAKSPFDNVHVYGPGDIDTRPIDLIGNRRRDIKRLLKTNPAAVGQLLINKPEYAKMVCNLIVDIENADETDETWDEVFFWGGIVVGGVLMATGLVVVGGAIIARTVATTAMLKSIGTMVTIAGAVTGTVESGYYTKEVLQAKFRMVETEEAFISGNGDAYSIVESKEILKEFNKAKFTLALTLGFTAIDIAGIYAIMKGMRYKASGLDSVHKQKIQSLDKMTETINKILGNKTLIKQSKKLIKTHGAAKVAKLISILGHASKKTRNSILLKLELEGAAKFKSMLSTALRSVRECSK